MVKNGMTYTVLNSNFVRIIPGRRGAAVKLLLVRPFNEEKRLPSELTRKDAQRRTIQMRETNAVCIGTMFYTALTALLYDGGYEGSTFNLERILSGSKKSTLSRNTLSIDEIDKERIIVMEKFLATMFSQRRVDLTLDDILAKLNQAIYSVQLL
jgi:hypothetical protein